VSDYQAVYEDLFVKNLRKYSSMKKSAKNKINRLLEDPYHNTEFLGDHRGQLNLTGCRSIRIDRNFRIFFVVCEECRNIQDCEFCFCEDLPDKTVVFLVIGPHDKACLVSTAPPPFLGSKKKVLI
jgi:mRNA-degrading endonuclease YafQ of YafQ-DinJ toxin-antitoxin module